MCLSIRTFTGVFLAAFSFAGGEFEYTKCAKKQKVIALICILLF